MTIISEKNQTPESKAYENKVQVRNYQIALTHCEILNNWSEKTNNK